MIRKIYSAFTGTSRLVQVLIGLAFLVILAFTVTNLLSTRSEMPGEAGTLAQPTATPSDAGPSDAEGDHTVPLITKGGDGTKDPTKDWLVYRNDDFGFSIKYSPNFKAVETNTDKDEALESDVGFLYKDKYEDWPQRPFIGLTVYNNSPGLSLEQWLDQAKVKAVSSNFHDEQQATIGIQQANRKQNVEALRYTEKYTPIDIDIHSLLLKKGDKIVELSYSNLGVEGEDLEPVYSLMLQTLEFTK